MKMKTAFLLLGSLLISSPVFAETIELVTYYPAPGAGNDQNVRSLTVGTGYAGVTPADGTALIRDRLGIGDVFTAANPPLGSLHVVGPDGENDRVLFMPGAGGSMTVAIGNGGLGVPTAEGTASAGDKLVVWNDAATLKHKAAIGLNAASELWLQSSGNNATNKIAFYTSNTSATPAQRMVIDSAGSVGIGTAAPERRLHVHEPSGNSVYLKLSNADTGVTATDGLYVGYVADETAILSNAENTALRFDTNNVERMRIAANGNVGIGTGAPNYKLEVASSGDYNQSIYSRATDGGLTRFGLQNTARHWSISGYGPTQAPYSGWFAIADETAGVLRLWISPDGNVGIGTHPSPTILWGPRSLTQWLPRSSHRLTFTGFYNSGGPSQPYLEYGINDSALFGIPSFLSSRENKTDISKIEADTGKIYDLVPVSFYYKTPGIKGKERAKIEPGTPKAFGLIAEDVEEIFPQLIMRPEKGGKIAGLDYSRLSVLMLPEMKKLRDAVEELQAQNKAQQRRIEELEGRLPK